ncbi:MAG: hypothetical protein WBG69_01350 [Arcobacteraceae bacterium]
MKQQREQAEILIKKVLEEKSFLVLTQEEKTFLIDEYSDEMKVASSDYEKYLALSESEKLVDIVLVALKEYMGSWHVSTEQMNELSEYMKGIVKG